MFQVRYPAVTTSTTLSSADHRDRYQAGDMVHSRADGTVPSRAEGTVPFRADGTVPSRADDGLHPLLADRRSSRAFDEGHQLDEATLMCLLEAARWAPSANNSQPWRFGVARRGEAAFDALAGALSPGNRGWAARASVLLLVAAADADSSGRHLPWATYDVGQSVAHLTVQAQAAGLLVHQMGGFDARAAAHVFDLPASVTPLVVVALGRHDPDAALPEPLAERERAPRTRAEVEELLLPAAVPAEPLPLSA
jgi:nitroreductase